LLHQTFLMPVVALVLWTVVIWVWMYAKRISAMRTGKIHPQKMTRPTGERRQKIPKKVQWVSDNCNHMHEQPTAFYAVMFAIALMELAGGFALGIAWV